jgi:hypothetical protein
MKLSHIEQSIKGQFIWKNRKKRASETEFEYQKRLKTIHRFHVDEERECMKGMALIVFCGIAHSYQIDDDEVADYLGIDYRLQVYYLNIFHKYTKKAAELKETGRFNPSRPAEKLMIKTGLCRNYIKFHFSSL